MFWTIVEDPLTYLVGSGHGGVLFRDCSRKALRLLQDVVAALLGPHMYIVIIIIVISSIVTITLYVYIYIYTCIYIYIYIYKNMLCHIPHSLTLRTRSPTGFSNSCHVCMYVCTYVRKYVLCMSVCLSVCLSVCMYVCIPAFLKGTFQWYSGTDNFSTPYIREEYEFTLPLVNPRLEPKWPESGVLDMQIKNMVLTLSSNNLPYVQVTAER